MKLKQIHETIDIIARQVSIDCIIAMHQHKDIFEGRSEWDIEDIKEEIADRIIEEIKHAVAEGI